MAGVSVEVQIDTVDSWPRSYTRSTFTSLGQVAFGRPKAELPKKQLRQIRVNSECSSIKLLFGECVDDPRNKFNQISVIWIRVLGRAAATTGVVYDTHKYTGIHRVASGYYAMQQEQQQQQQQQQSSTSSPPPPQPPPGQKHQQQKQPLPSALKHSSSGVVDSAVADDANKHPTVSFAVRNNSHNGTDNSATSSATNNNNHHNNNNNNGSAPITDSAAVIIDPVSSATSGNAVDGPQPLPNRQPGSLMRDFNIPKRRANQNVDMILMDLGLPVFPLTSVNGHGAAGGAGAGGVAAGGAGVIAQTTGAGQGVFDHAYHSEHARVARGREVRETALPAAFNTGAQAVAREATIESFLQRLAARKQKCLAYEFYDEAHELKQSMDKLQDIQDRMHNLEQQKQYAILVERYDQAHQIRLEMLKYHRRAANIVHKLSSRDPARYALQDEDFRARPQDRGRRRRQLRKLATSLDGGPGGNRNQGEADVEWDLEQNAALPGDAHQRQRRRRRGNGGHRNGADGADVYDDNDIIYNENSYMSQDAGNAPLMELRQSLAAIEREVRSRHDKDDDGADAHGKGKGKQKRGDQKQQVSRQRSLSALDILNDNDDDDDMNNDEHKHDATRTGTRNHDDDGGGGGGGDDDDDEATSSRGVGGGAGDDAVKPAVGYGLKRSNSLPPSSNRADLSAVDTTTLDVQPLFDGDDAEKVAYAADDDTYYRATAATHRDHNKQDSMNSADERGDAADDEVNEASLVSVSAVEMEPEPLSPEHLAVAEPLFEIFSRRVMQCFFSQQWAWREYALQAMEERVAMDSHVMSRSVSEFRSLFKACATVLRLACTDSVAQVYLAFLSFLYTVLNAYQHGTDIVRPEEAASQLKKVLHTLADRSGNPNRRVREASSDALLHMAEHPLFDHNIVASSVVRKMTGDPQRRWRVFVGRLFVLEQLISLFGIVAMPKEGAAESEGLVLSPVALSLEHVMPFVARALQHPVSYVRQSAVRVCLEVYKLVGEPAKVFVDGLRANMIVSLRKERPVSGVPSNPDDDRPPSSSSRH